VGRDVDDKKYEDELTGPTINKHMEVLPPLINIWGFTTIKSMSFKTEPRL